MNHESNVEIVDMPEIKLIGLAVTCPFAGHNPDRVESMKQQFFERKHEIRDIIRPDRYMSPHFVSDILFTYLICMEVSHVAEIPDGMIGFAIPPRRYARTRSTGDPYQVIHNYLDENSLQNNKRGLAIEVYSFTNPKWPDETDVYIPLL